MFLTFYVSIKWDCTVTIALYIFPFHSMLWKHFTYHCLISFSVTETHHESTKYMYKEYSLYSYLDIIYSQYVWDISWSTVSCFNLEFFFPIFSFYSNAKLMNSENWPFFLLRVKVHSIIGLHFYWRCIFSPMLYSVLRLWKDFYGSSKSKPLSIIKTIFCYQKVKNHIKLVIYTSAGKAMAVQCKLTILLCKSQLMSGPAHTAHHWRRSGRAGSLNLTFMWFSQYLKKLPRLAL